ncbi:condensation domain-containing protein [Kribbella sp. NPDC051718]|uniref:condensation domain-containing protein n=1 Tax=Kribbella sp. NPDC051718 TaxID=3155168 RepID=UPI00344A92D6
MTRVPLAFPQHLLRFFDVLHPGQATGPAFVISAAYRVSGPVDEELLRLAVTDLIGRHDALRATLHGGDGMPWQEIHEAGPGRFESIDLSGADPDDFLDSLDAREHPGDQSPLLWVYYAKLSPTDGRRRGGEPSAAGGVLALVAHHSAADAWSMDLLVRDLATCYAARIEGRLVQPVAGSTYADFAVDDQAQRDSPRSARALDYWSAKLADVDVTSLPSDRPREAKDDGIRAQLRFDIDKTLAVRLTEAARRARCSPFMVHLTAYLLTLRELTGATDLTVPTLTAGRGRPELDETVGFFLNALLLRTDLSTSTSPGEALAEVRRTCLDAYRNELPILRLLEEVPDAGLLLADESFVLMPFQHIPLGRREPRKFGPATYVSFDRRPGSRPHGVAVPLDGLWTIDERPGGLLTGKISYTPAMFDASTLESHVDTYLRQLHTIATGT